MVPPSPRQIGDGDVPDQTYYESLIPQRQECLRSGADVARRAEPAQTQDRPMNRRVSAEQAPARRIPCLTEMSATVLIASAIGVSSLLWLAIFAVI